MNPRQNATAAGAAALAPPVAHAAYRYHLWRAAWIGLVSNLPIPRRLEIRDESGLRAFEDNQLPQHELAEIESVRKKRDERGLAAGVRVVNSGGWRGEVTADKKFHESFLEYVRRLVEVRRGGSRGAVGMEHSASVFGTDGSKKSFEACRRADSWSV